MTKLKTSIFLFVLVITSLAEAEESNIYDPYERYVLASVLNVRASSDPQSNLITKLKIGTKVLVINTDKAGDWSKVKLSDGAVGWVWSKHLYHHKPTLEKLLFTYEATPEKYGAVRRMWAERAAALVPDDPRAKKAFEESKDAKNSPANPDGNKVDSEPDENRQWIFAKPYNKAMSRAEINPSVIEVSDDDPSKAHMMHPFATKFEGRELKNVARFDFDNDGVKEVVVVGKSWHCTVGKEGCKYASTLGYTVIALRQGRWTTDYHQWYGWSPIMHRWGSWNVRGAFLIEEKNGVRVVAIENSHQCDYDRVDDYLLVWDPVNKKVVPDDPSKHNLFNLPGVDCGE